MPKGATVGVYGGDFFGAQRSEWNPEPLCEERYAIGKNMGLSEEARARLGAPGIEHGHPAQATLPPGPYRAEALPQVASLHKP